MIYRKDVPEVQKVQFSDFEDEETKSEEHKSINLLTNVKMEFVVELGNTKKQIKDILSMKVGTVIELDKVAGEPVDILINYKKLARGEVVILDNFSVRITEILEPSKRISDDD